MIAAIFGLPKFTAWDNGKPRWSTIYRSLSDLMTTLETYSKKPVRLFTTSGEHDDDSKHIHITMSVGGDASGRLAILIHDAEIFSLMCEMYIANGDINTDSIEHSLLGSETSPTTYKMSSFTVGYMRFENMQAQPMHTTSDKVAK